MRTSELTMNRSGGSVLNVAIFESLSWIAPADGILEIRAMGAGGAGCRRAGQAETATGGYSGSWGVKRVRIKKGDAVTVTIGAAGVVSGSGQPGGAGGNTTITVNGATYVAYGGPGGLWSSGAAITVPAGPEPSANWDFGARSVRPGMLAGSATGGAGVDIMMRGNDATTSAAYGGGGGGGTGGPSVMGRGGGAAPGGTDAMGFLSTGATTGSFFDASSGEWGISFFGGGGGASSANGLDGGNGGGGGGSSTGSGGKGGNGGGGGSCSTNGMGGVGGIGGGGGAGIGNSGAGGKGYAYLSFVTDKGV